MLACACGVLNSPGKLPDSHLDLATGCTVLYEKLADFVVHPVFPTVECPKKGEGIERIE